ncbi:MAG: peptide ABC transporter substrate-binding protein [Candidatus Dormibacteria bacterium]
MQVRRRLTPTLLVAMVGMVASCSPMQELPTRKPVPSGARSPAPRARGGTVNIALWQEPASFLAAGVVERDTFANVIAAPVAEGLLWYRAVADVTGARGPADHWRPALATEVPTLENGGVRTRGCGNAAAAMCVTWRLREGVRWHDGSAFSSHDVCDTFKLFHLRYGDSNPTALLTSAGWDQVIDCSEVDLTTAVVDFKTQYGPYLTLGSGVYGVLPASILDPAFRSNADLQSFTRDVDLTRGSRNREAFRGSASLDRMIDGTGPFVFAGAEAGRQVTLVANREYWDRDRIPKLDRLVFIFEPDVAAAVNAVRSGTVDMAFDLRLANLRGLIETASGGGLAVQTVADAGAEKLDLNVCANAARLCDVPAARRSPYTADRAVRRAILAGVDRQAIIDRVAAGRSTIPPDSWMALGIPELRDAAVPTTVHDPAAAARILDEAGYALSPSCDGGRTRAFSDGSCISVNLGTTTDDPSRLIAESLVAGDLAAIGIRVVQPFTPNVPSATFFDTVANGGPLYSHAYDVGMYTSKLVSPGEPDRYYSLYHGDCHGACPASSQIPAAANGGAGENATGENSAEVDRALDSGRRSVDAGTRTRAYRSAERALARDLPEIPLYQHVTVNAHSTAIQGVRDNEVVWDFNTADWSCAGGSCRPQPVPAATPP